MDPSSLSVQSKSVVDIRDVPKNVLKLILENLVYVKLKSLTKESMLAFRNGLIDGRKYRQVCKVWMELTDEVMEQSLVSSIQMMIPNRGSEDFLPNTVVTLVINKTIRVSVNGDAIEYPSFIVNSKGCNPFAGNSLTLTCLDGDSVQEIISPIVNDLSLKWTHNVSVLCLKEMSLDLESFILMLKSSKSLRVLIVQDFRVGVKDDNQLCSLQLPELSKLRTIMILKYFCVAGYYMGANKKLQISRQPLHNYSSWFFNPYAKQIENLEIKYDRAVQIDPMPELRKLSLVFTSSNLYLNQFDTLPKLEMLNITSVKGIIIEGLMNFNEVMMFMSRFANTLTNVYVDMETFNAIENDTLFQNRDAGEQQQHFTQFPNACKVTTIYPKSKEEGRSFRDRLLLHFPCLEHLVLLRYEKDEYLYPFYYAKETFKPAYACYMSSSWQACANLKTITVLNRQRQRPISNNFYIKSTLGRPIAL